MSFLEKLNWRYATKKFDPDKKVSDDNKRQILEAVRMAPSSRGLQPFHVFVISDAALRAKLRPAAKDQAQITDSSFLLVFCSKTDLANRGEEYVKAASGGDEDIKMSLENFRKSVAAAMTDKSEEELENWAAKQIHIALGFGIAACMELEIDSCPMEGFDHQAFNEILALPGHLRTQVLLAVGYRSSADKIRPKVRFPASDLFTFLD